MNICAYVAVILCQSLKFRLLVSFIAQHVPAVCPGIVTCPSLDQGEQELRLAASYAVTRDRDIVFEENKLSMRGRETADLTALKALHVWGSNQLSHGGQE